MSKKVFNVFSILCFALVLCFMGCTELINPKTETDINLNIDLSKIIKSTRNTGETQSSASIGENPTIKVAIYDAKKYNATTNLTDDLDLITEAQAKIENNKAKVKLNNIPVGIYAIVFAELSLSNGNSTEVMYAGNSKVFRVEASNNKISLVLIKVGNSEISPDDSNTSYEISSWDELKTQIDKLSDDTTPTEFVIMNDLIATSTITVSKPVKITSDKNVTISRGNSSDGGNFKDSFFRVESAGNLELEGKENSTITITLDGGNANAIYIEAEAPLITSSGNLTLTNCTLQNNTLNNTVPDFGNGGAVYVSGGTFTMNGDRTIRNCKANENGGAVYITDKGTFNMNGGSIAECSASNSGGGVCMNSGSTFTMSGGKIDTCNSDSEGGGVYVAGGDNLCTFEMLDSTIIGCSAGNGGGICLYGKLTMEGWCYVDSINDNDVYLASGTTVTVAGELTYEGIVATITPENYEEGTPVITAAGIELVNYVGKFALSDESGQFKIAEDGTIAKVNTEQNLSTVLLGINANIYNVKQLPSGIYYLESNLELDYPVYISDDDVVIYAKEDAIITGSSIGTDCFFSVSDGCSLTFGKDESTDATLTINAKEKLYSDAVLNAGYDGTLNIKNKVICTGATNQSFITTAGGTVNISGGKITENHGESPVIYITGGTVNITGGEISNNLCVNMRGACSGILVSSGTLKISGTTTTISNNQFGVDSDNLEDHGASIYNDAGTVTILNTSLEPKQEFTQNIINGEIPDVTTGGGGNESLIGGAYYVSAEGNDTTNNGLSSESPFKTLKKAITTANTSESKTVYVIGTLNATSEGFSGASGPSESNSVFYIQDSNLGTADEPIQIIGYGDESTLSAEDATSTYSRVFATKNASHIKMKNLKITGGNTEGSGGAIYFWQGSLILENCSIKNNNCTKTDSTSGISYDGIYMYGEGNKLNMVNTICSDGIYLSNSTATIGDGCSLGYDQNESPIIHIDNSQLTLSGSVQLNNPIYSDAKSPIFVGSTLTTHNSNNKITIKLSDYNISDQILSVEDGSNLEDEVQKFSLADSAHSITNKGYIE